MNLLVGQRPDLVYSCDFVGDANGLVTYEECYLLIHLLQSELLFVFAFYLPQILEEGAMLIEY